MCCRGPADHGREREGLRPDVPGGQPVHRGHVGGHEALALSAGPRIEGFDGSPGIGVPMGGDATARGARTRMVTRTVAPIRTVSGSTRMPYSTDPALAELPGASRSRASYLHHAEPARGPPARTGRRRRRPAPVATRVEGQCAPARHHPRVKPSDGGRALATAEELEQRLHDAASRAYDDLVDRQLVEEQAPRLPVLAAPTFRRRTRRALVSTSTSRPFSGSTEPDDAGVGIMLERILDRDGDDVVPLAVGYLYPLPPSSRHYVLLCLYLFLLNFCVICFPFLLPPPPPPQTTFPSVHRKYFFYVSCR